MTNWGDIPINVAVKILELLKFHEDFMAFSGVCTRWRSVVKEAKFHACVPTRSLPWSSSSSSLALPHDHRHELPWLMVPDQSHDHDLDRDRDFSPSANNHPWLIMYSLCYRTFRHLELPPSPCCCIGVYHRQQEQGILSSRGWLLSLTEEASPDLTVSLLNPFSGAQIQLPTLEIYSRTMQRVVPFRYNVGLFEKFILSGNPDDDNYSVALILQEPFPNLSLKFEIVVSWKKGDDHWVQLRTLNNSRGWPFLHLCSDITSYNGEFYTVDEKGNLLAFGPAQSRPRLVAGFGDQGGLFSPPSFNEVRTYPPTVIKLFYLVESMGRLLLLCRVKALIEDNYHTISFLVFEVNVVNGDAEEVHTLGSRSVFLGANSSFSVRASPSHGCKPNCIYYTHDYRELYYEAAEFNRGRKDSGIFNLATGKIESCSYHGSLCVTDSTSTPPMWLESPASCITNFSLSCLS